MYSSNGGDTPAAAAALNTRDSGFSMPSDHSAAVWERQGLGRDKFDRERYTPTKRDWAVESRSSSSYRSSGALSASGSLTASFNKRRAIGRHETVIENGRFRSAVGRSSESSNSLRSPSQIGKAERDVCSPGYGGSPSMERQSKAVDGHHYRDAHLSPGNARPLSSPRFDSRLHGNQNDSDGLGPWDRERSRFSSPPNAWDGPNRGREYRERPWSRPDYRRACPLPKLDSSREWSQSDRELLEGRIDRYSSVSGREVGFSDVLSANNRDRHEWRSRDRALQSGVSSQIPSYPPTNNVYNRDSKNVSLAPDALGAASPPQHSPLHSSFSHDSDQECLGPGTSKKRPRLTWGQGLAKYEKEKTGEDYPVAKKSEEGSNYVGGLHSDGSVASTLPEVSLQTSNALPCSEDHQSCEKRIQNSDFCSEGVHQAEPCHALCPGPVANSSVDVCTREALAERKVDRSVNVRKVDDSVHVSNNLESSYSEVVVAGTPASGCLVLQYMQGFLSRYQQELPHLSKDVLTQHVEKVEFEIDRLEKEILKLDKEHDTDIFMYEKEVVGSLASSTIEMHSSLDSVVGVLKPPTSLLSVPGEGSPSPVDTAAVKVFTVDAGGNGAVDLLDVALHAEESSIGHEGIDRVMRESSIGHESMDQEGITGSKEQSVACVAQIDFSAVQPRKVNREGECGGFEGSRMFDEDWRDSITSLLLSNQKIAEQSSSALAHLNAPEVENELHAGMYSCGIQESSVWKQNLEKHDRIRRLLESNVAEEKSLRRFAEGVLAVKYRAKREAWKQEQIGNYCSKDRDKCFGIWEADGNFNLCRQSPLRPCPTTGFLVPDANNEEVQVTKKLLMESPVDIEREYVRMPSMVLGQKERALHRFEMKNALVEDPVAAEQERKTVNPWLAEERKIFLEKYSLLGKNLREIASFLEHKTVADCVQFFYQNQKTEEFEKIHRRHQLKKRRDSRSSALYLATTTSVSSRHREANAAYVEGLSLVAAAAAAMSVSRDLSRPVRSQAMKSGPSASTSSKTCRDSNLLHQVSPTSTLTGKDSNVEHIGGKCAQNTHSRSLKRPPEEVLQWRSQWNDNERELFMNAVAMFGKDFNSISSYIGSKSLGQCKTYFSKARKRLGLDQLVERHKAILLETRQEEENFTNQMNGRKVQVHVSGMEVDSNFKIGDVSEQQLKVERSPLHVNSCLGSEARYDSAHVNREFEVISTLCSPQSLQAADHTGSVLPNGNAGQQAVNISLNQGASSTSHGRNGNVEVFSLDAVVQGCTDDSLVCEEASHTKTLPINVKTETLIASNIATGASNATSSCIHGTIPSTVVSTVVPSSLTPAPLMQSSQFKDKSLKATEVKVRREPTSWTQEEKEKFVDILKVHGKNWDLLCKSLPAKSLIQIKTYFQNSKAKLGLGSEGIVNNPGRGGSSWKRKVDDSDSSSNAGSGGGQIVSQKAPVLSDDGSLKVSPSILAPPGGPGGNVLSSEALAYANLFGRKLLEDSINAQKAFHAMGLAQNTSTPGILPMLTSAVFSPPNLVSAQQSYMHAASASMKIPQIMNHQQSEQALSSLMAVVEPSSSAQGIHQALQLQPQSQVSGTCQDLSLPVMQPIQIQPQQIDQKALFQQVSPPSQQLQQVAEAVLQQLLPQAVQRHQQQLQLAVQQAPHHFQQALSHHQAQSNRHVPSQSVNQMSQGINQAVNQLSQGMNQAMSFQAGAVPASIVAGHQKQPQSGLLQAQLHQMQGKLQALLQQQQHVPQLHQLQFLRLQRQQQQLIHLQQAQVFSQSQQIQNQTLHVQQQSHNLSNEQQQQQLAFLKGFTHVSSANGESSMQNDTDTHALGKSQQGAFVDVHHPFVPNQGNEAPSKIQAGSEVQFPAGDVKLFGQSLLLQPASVTQISNVKVPSSLSPSGCSSALSSSINAGSMTSNGLPKVPWDYVLQGQGWHQSSRPSACSNGTIVTDTGDSEMGSLSVQGPVSCSSERYKRDARDVSDGRTVDISHGSLVSRVPDGMALSSVLTSSDNGTSSNAISLSRGPSGELLRGENDNDIVKSGQVANVNQGIQLNMNRKQESNAFAGIIGGEVVAPQGLPRVLDALVALAEWRLQNSTGCSGKLTDEFLSQSWEALQKDPGALIEAGKAGGSLSQLHSEGPQMLQHLRERLLLSHTGLLHLQPGDGGAMGPGLENAVHACEGQNVPLQTTHSQVGAHDPVRSDDCGIMEADCSGGAIG